MIRLYISSHLSSDELREIFLFFDSGFSYVFLENGFDMISNTPVYEMNFPSNSLFGVRFYDYVRNGNLPDTILDIIRVIPPKIITVGDEASFLSGELSDLNW
jgi:hypothetical protein